MNRTRRILALSTTITALAAAPAQAAPEAPPIADGVHCHQTAKPAYRLSAVEKRGLPVRITCDGPARVQIIFSFDAMTPQKRELTRMFPHSSPGICRSRDVAVPAAGTITVRPQLMPYGARIARRYPRSKLILHFLTLREDGHFWTEGLMNRHTFLVR
jgi:hypothetical protein